MPLIKVSVYSGDNQVTLTVTLLISQIKAMVEVTRSGPRSM